MDILKTFDLFWSLPEKLFGKKFFRVCHVETTAGGESAIHADVSDDEVTLNVYNSPKTYSLLASVLYKKKMLNESKISKIHNLRTFS